MANKSPAAARNRKRAERRGHLGEMLAALYLRLKLYRVVARRVKTPLGEIDLIARKGDTLAFVEVKTRTHAADEAQAHAAVNRKRIIRAAKYYLSRDPRCDGLTIRFDLIFLGGLSWPRHIPSAFEDNR
jgi:putative endonuclease